MAGGVQMYLLYSPGGKQVVPTLQRQAPSTVILALALALESESLWRSGEEVTGSPSDPNVRKQAEG